jgi:hypothetical protein
MFLADWVAATGTTGAGSFTLTALPGFANFNEPFGTAGTFVVWYESDDGVGNFEAGYGALTLGAGNGSTLTRTPLMTRTSSAAYTRGRSASALNFTVAPTVRISPLAEGLLPSAGPLYASGNWFPANQAVAIAATSPALPANTIMRTVVDWKLAVPVSALGLYIEGGNAAGNIRFALYAPTASGDAGALMFDSGNLSTASTGITGVTSPLFIPPGQYYLDINCSISTVTLAANGGSGGAAGTSNVVPLWADVTFDSKISVFLKNSVPFGAPTNPAPANSGFGTFNSMTDNNQGPNTWSQFLLYAKA